MGGDAFRERLKAEGLKLGELTKQKNTNYGNSWEITAKVLSVFFPEGIATESYGTVLLLVRVFDKVARLAQTERFGINDEESPWRDIAGYGLLAYVADLVEDERSSDGKAG